MPSAKKRYPIGRICVIRKESLSKFSYGYFSPEEAGKHLGYTIKEHWPEKNACVDILVTPGAFINEVKSEEYGWENNKRWDATKRDIVKFAERGKENVKTMLKAGDIFNVAKGKVEFISIGCDVRYSDQIKAELVFLVDINSKKILEPTGKSYPTNSYEENRLVQVVDLKTHFKKVLNHRVMILGCHDINMFSHRAHAMMKEFSNKWLRSKDMSEITCRFKPTMVLHHPHQTDSPNVWKVAWSGVRNDYPSVKFWASGISYYTDEKKYEKHKNKVLDATKSGDNTVLEIELKKCTKR